MKGKYVPVTPVPKKTAKQRKEEREEQERADAEAAFYSLSVIERDSIREEFKNASVPSYVAWYRDAKHLIPKRKQTLEVIIRYRVPVRDANMDDVLDKLRELGSAEVITARTDDKDI